jgi:DNA polymerase III epsilon subunit-like protein
MDEELEPASPKRARTAPSGTTCRIFYDCETSGKGCPNFKQDRIIELAAVAAHAPGSALATKGLGRRRHGVLPDGFFSEFVSGGPCAPRATAVHGLSDEDLRGARPFEAVWQSFVAFAHDAQERQPHCTAVSLVGHNSLFADNYWLLSELARCGREVQELALPGRRVVFEDTYPKSEDARRRLKADLKLRSLKNSEVHHSLWPEQAGGTEAHTALWDAAATRDNWRHARVRRSAERLSAAQQEGHWKVLQARNVLDALPGDVSDGDAAP